MRSASEIADSWAASFANPTTQAKIKSGVQAVTVSPPQKAALHLDRYLIGTAEAVNSGQMAASLNAVSLSSWQNDMLTKGVPRIASGAQAAKPKMVKFLTAFLPHVAAGKAIVDSMPKGTVEDGIARAAAMIRHNAGFTYKK